MLPSLGTYVYLASLTNTDPDYAADARAYSTFNAQNPMMSGGGNIIQPLDKAFALLQTIAQAQSQREHLAVQSYLRKLDATLANTEGLPKELINNLQKQRNMIASLNLDFKDYTSSQEQLTKAINITIQNLNSYERRLQEITTPVKDTIEFNNRLEFNIQTRLEEFFRHSGLKKSGTQEGKRDRALNAMMNKALAGLPAEIINEVKALLFIDFNNWVENDANQKQSYTELTMDDITPMFEEYLKLAENEFTETHLQRLRRTSQEDFLDLIDEMKKVLHSDFISQSDVEYLKSQVQTKNKKQDIAFKDKTISYKQARDYITTYNYNLGQPEDRYVITLHSKTSHGGFYEHIGTIFTSATNISANVGADKLIPVATVTITKKEQQEQQILMNLTRGLSNILTEDFNQKKQLAIEEFETGVAKERALADAMKNKIEEQRKAINSIDDLNQKFFIAHESTKLYRGAEQEGSLFKEFHGRRMNAMSALTKMYASPIVADSMINPQALMLYLINISGATLAVNKQPLETYLSLFAGLLMFDDIAAIAEAQILDIKQNIATESSIDCIHVYNIGGIYMPVSAILNNMIAQMNDVMSTLTINSNKTARAEISGPTPSSPKNATESTWSSVANSTMAGTTIKIYFLAGFSDFVQALSTGNFN